MTGILPQKMKALLQDQENIPALRVKRFQYECCNEGMDE
jgi:hypothetical protein